MEDELLKDVYVIYMIPWMSVEMSDAYEDVSAVNIIGVARSLDVAKTVAKKYADKMVKNSYTIIKTEEKPLSIYKLIIYMDMGFDDDGKKYNEEDDIVFNELNGGAIVVKLIQ